MMQVTVEVEVSGTAAPPSGVPVIVQVVDTAMQDVRSTVMAEKRTKCTDARDGVIAKATLDVPQPGAYPTVYVHVDVDRDGKVSEGDYITMQSYPARSGVMRVAVKKV